jgi:tRNA acetyltransferase TAN1
VTSSGGLLGSSPIGSLHADPSAKLFAQTEPWIS